MNLFFLSQFKAKTQNWPPLLISIIAAIAAFCTYTCMYAFRKAFAAATFDGIVFLSIDYKVWLVIAQVLGYTLSKFYGIRFVSEIKSNYRGLSIITLIIFSWLALLGFALTPAPYNILFLFLNGLPLGMIWGLVFSYLEGRRTTEFMAAVMSVSMIFASGFIKTIGRTLITSFNVSEFWMPFVTGLVFIIPLLVCVYVLELIPLPSPQDKLSRAERIPMDASQRRKFLLKFLPGIVLTIVIYTLLTIMRDVRDNFEVEIWNDLGVYNSSIYTNIDTFIAIIVLLMMGLLTLIKDNGTAFTVIHSLIISGCLIIGIATLMYQHNYISPTLWMIFSGLGLYMGYLPYNAIFFERMIATFKYKSNVGFVMYLADAMGYLGSISVLLFKQFGNTDKSWALFFEHGLYTVAIIGGIAATGSLLYFSLKSSRQQTTLKSKLTIQYG